MKTVRRMVLRALRICVIVAFIVPPLISIAFAPLEGNAEESHFITYQYQDNKQYEISCRAGTECPVTLMPGDHVTSAFDSDANSWSPHVGYSGTDDKSTATIIVRPTKGNLLSNVIVNTTTRTYYFVYSSCSSCPISYYHFAPARSNEPPRLAEHIMQVPGVLQTPEPSLADVDLGKVCNRDLFSVDAQPSEWHPTQVCTDGRHTYIQLPLYDDDRTDVPVLFQLDSDGNRAMNNYTYDARKARYVVDGVYDSLALVGGTPSKPWSLRILHTNPRALVMPEPTPTPMLMPGANPYPKKVYVTPPPVLASAPVQLTHEGDAPQRVAVESLPPPQGTADLAPAAPAPVHFSDYSRRRLAASRTAIRAATPIVRYIGGAKYVMVAPPPTPKPRVKPAPPLVRYIGGAKYVMVAQAPRPTPRPTPTPPAVRYVGGIKYVLARSSAPRPQRAPMVPHVVYTPAPRRLAMPVHIAAAAPSDPPPTPNPSPTRAVVPVSLAAAPANVQTSIQNRTTLPFPDHPVPIYDVSGAIVAYTNDDLQQNPHFAPVVTAEGSLSGFFMVTPPGSAIPSQTTGLKTVNASAAACPQGSSWDKQTGWSRTFKYTAQGVDAFVTANAIKHGAVSRGLFGAIKTPFGFIVGQAVENLIMDRLTQHTCNRTTNVLNMTTGLSALLNALRDH